MADARAWRWGLAVLAATGAALALAQLVDSTAPAALQAPGTVLQQALERGVLRVGVREYPRPSLPSDPLPPEPDNLDAGLARHIAQQIGVPVQLVGLAAEQVAPALAAAQVDLVLAGSPATPHALPHRSSVAYLLGPARIVVLRNGPLASAAHLAGQSVCVAEGSPYAAPLQERHGARPVVLRSAVHAISAFMAGECAALAEDEGLVERLLAQTEWRYYRALEPRLAPARTAQALLPRADPASAAYLDAVLERWTQSGTQARARLQRSSEVALEVALLEDGAICH